jgi:hypothetical protein
LASSFDGVKLHDEALAQYDSLESSFFGVLQEKSLSWFGNLIPDAASLASEISLPLLSTDKRPYRDLIMANTISVFDFRVYLLAQQCNLLGKMTRVVQVAKKVTTFLGAFGRRLREVSVCQRRVTPPSVCILIQVLGQVTPTFHRELVLHFRSQRR